MQAMKSMKSMKSYSGEIGEGSPLLSEQDMFHQYCATCSFYQIHACADALIRLEQGRPKLMVEPDAGRHFGNLELRALVHLLESEDGAQLEKVKELDFSRACLGASGAMLVKQVLEHNRCAVEELNMSSQTLGEEGAEAIAEGLLNCHSLHTVHLNSCGLGTSGARVFVQLLNMGKETHGLNTLDLQNNFIDYKECRELLAAAKEQNITLDLQGNRILDEVFNAVSHGIGAVLAILGTVFLGIACKDKPSYYVTGIVPYCVSLIVLFVSSSLYHSMHALGRIVNLIFCTLDHSAIYLLIAGTYTPFLAILFHSCWWSTPFLVGIWVAAGLGIVFTVNYNGDYKVHIENLFYLVMGWSCLMFGYEAYVRLNAPGFALLVGGGVIYSIGVIWFVKDGHTMGIPDHLIWHLCVLAAAACHFFCIYCHVVQLYPWQHPIHKQGTW